MVNLILFMCLCLVPMVLEIVSDICDIVNYIRHPKNEDKWYEFLEQSEKDYNELKKMIREKREQA